MAMLPQPQQQRHQKNLTRLYAGVQRVFVRQKGLGLPPSPRRAPCMHRLESLRQQTHLGARTWGAWPLKVKERNDREHRNEVFSKRTPQERWRELLHAVRGGIERGGFVGQQQT